MTRLILAILVALSLVGTSGPAFAGLSHTCPMGATSTGMGMDHDELDCCTPGCAVVCVPAVVADGANLLSEPPAAPVAGVAPTADSVHPFNPAAIDPPPRSFA